MTVNAALALESRCRSSSDPALAAPHWGTVNTFKAAGSKKSGMGNGSFDTSKQPCSMRPGVALLHFNELFQV